MINVDIAEPQKIVDLIKQSVEVDTLELNQNGFADYVFTTADGVLVQIEREQMRTVMSNPVQIEDEIRRHLHDGRMILITEGVVVPYHDGCMVTDINMAKAGAYLKPALYLRVRYGAYIAWLWQLQENGIDVIHTNSPFETVVAICSIYNNAQNKEHGMFKRYYKNITRWQPNRHVQALMNIPESGIGEKRAIMLIEKFETLYNVITADEMELAKCIGKATAKKLLKAVGRG